MTGLLWTFITLLFLYLSLMWVKRINPKNISDLAAFPIQLGGIIIGLFILAIVVPQIFLRGSVMVRRGWTPVINSTQSDGQAAWSGIAQWWQSTGDSAYVPLDETAYADGDAGESDLSIEVPAAPAPTAVPPVAAPAAAPDVETEIAITQYTVVAGDTWDNIAARFDDLSADDIAAQNNLSTEVNLTTGQVLVIEFERVAAAQPAVAAQPRPAPTAAPTAVPQDLGCAVPLGNRLSFIDCFERIAQAEADGRRTSGMSLIQQVLALDPTNATALEQLDMIERAVTLIERTPALDDYTEIRLFGGGKTYTYGQDSHNLVADMLAGYCYQVIDRGSLLLGGTKWNQATLVEVTDGWAKGHRFSLAVGHADRFGGNATGRVFCVS